MTRQIVRTENAPQNAAYSQAVRAGGLVFVSGQGPFDATSGAIVGSTIQEQTRQCLTNVQAILELKIDFRHSHSPVEIAQIQLS